MSPACQSMAPLLSLRSGDLEGSEGEALAAHLASCPACADRHRRASETRARLEEAAARLGAGYPEAWRPRLLPWRPWRWAAGAAAALALWLLPETAPFRRAPTPSPAPSGELPSPASLAEAPFAPPGPGGRALGVPRDAEWVMGRGILFSARKGSLLVPGRGPEGLRLEAGCLHVDSPGERLMLGAGDAVLLLSDAELTVEVPEPPRQAGWLMPSAWADEPLPVLLTVWRGSAEWVRGSERRTVRAGEVPQTLWRGLPGWTALGGGAGEAPLILRNETRVLLPDPPEGGYVLECLVRKRCPSAEVGLRLDVAGLCHEAPAGPCLGGGEGWTRLRLELDRKRARASAGSEGIAEAPRSEPWRLGPGCSGRGAGLRVWGGDVEIKEVRWRR